MIRNNVQNLTNVEKLDTLVIYLKLDYKIGLVRYVFFSWRCHAKHQRGWRY